MHHGSRNFEKVKMGKTNTNFEKFQNTGNHIYTACAMLKMMIYAMFAIVSMVHITGVEISKKSKCPEQTAVSKSLKTLKISYTQCAQCSEIMI